MHEFDDLKDACSRPVQRLAPALCRLLYLSQNVTLYPDEYWELNYVHRLFYMLIYFIFIIWGLFIEHCSEIELYIYISLCNILKKHFVLFVIVFSKNSVLIVHWIQIQLIASKTWNSIESIFVHFTLHAIQ